MVTFRSHNHGFLRVITVIDIHGRPSFFYQNSVGLTLRSDRAVATTYRGYYGSRVLRTGFSHLKMSSSPSSRPPNPENTGKRFRSSSSSKATTTIEMPLFRLHLHSRQLDPREIIESLHGLYMAEAGVGAHLTSPPYSAVHATKQEIPSSGSLCMAFLWKLYTSYGRTSSIWMEKPNLNLAR